MDWMWAVLILVGVAQLTCGRDNNPSKQPSHLVRRNIVSRSPSGETEKDSSSDLFPGRVLYHLRPEDLEAPSAAYNDAPPDNLQSSSFLPQEMENSFPRLYADEETPFAFGGNSPRPNLSEEWDSNVNGLNLDEATNGNNNNNNIKNNNNNNDVIRDTLSPLNAEERVMLQKRLQMKGMGLLGGAKGGRPTSLLGGFSKSRPKGLVLSIDLGIKALRDAIMHAKVQQKNQQHQLQAQKNMRLLHSIGKRRAQSAAIERP